MVYNPLAMAEDLAISQLSLADLVSSIAEAPTSEKRLALYRMLPNCKLGGRVKGEAVKPQTITSTSITLPEVQAKDGTRLICGMTDSHELSAIAPEQQFFELEAAVILKLADKRGIGLLLTRESKFNKPFVVVPAADVRQILAGGFQPR